MRRSLRHLAFGALLAFAAVSPLGAQAGRGSDLTIKIAVAGPGSEVYFWFGHMALIIEDARTGQSRCYDYGLFSFENDNFFYNFAFGRLMYSSGVSSTEGSLSTYIFHNRSVTLYTLDLPPAKKEEIRKYAETSVLPENRNYLYHHFKQNCVHPVLRAVDMATDGQFMGLYGSEPGRFTLRQHVRRHTWFSPFLDWILNFWMGQDIDSPITVWDEMFLPSEVARRLLEFRYTDSDGISHQLVSNVETVYESQGRPEVLEAPRRQWPRELAFSLVLSAFLGCVYFLQKKSPAAGQVTLGILHSLLGLVFGVAGFMLFFMSFFTSHDYTYHNINLLFCNPLLLAAVPLGIRYASSANYNRRLRAEFALRLLWLLAALGVLASMLIKLSPRFWQQNLTDQVLVLPIAVTLSLEPAGLKRMLRRVFWRWL